MQLLSLQHWIGKHVRTAVLYFSKIKKCKNEQQYKKTEWSKTVPKALFVYTVFASEPASIEINDTSSLLLMETASGRIGRVC